MFIQPGFQKESWDAVYNMNKTEFDNFLILLVYNQLISLTEFCKYMLLNLMLATCLDQVG